ncbi:hypothetical protein [Klebsiella phage vB_KpnS_Uniso31]|uniref:Uncharacterized protein n=1 Tax=Klebsiella phage vB_KpnS_Uniso31 TaxID=2951200 RepID=A0A9E7NGJ5_9CAUD|nr:hypothetical protein [Klebsiella phage vB_KpnS_Uniso31]
MHIAHRIWLDRVLGIGHSVYYVVPAYDSYNTNDTQIWRP